MEEIQKEDKKLYIEDVMVELAIGRSKAYDLFHDKEFKAQMFAKKFFVWRSDFDEWKHRRNEKITKGGG